jgi:hypothetical protein
MDLWGVVVSCAPARAPAPPCNRGADLSERREFRLL